MMLNVLKEKAQRDKKFSVTKADSFNDEEMQKCQNYFINYDKDDNQRIDAWELRLCLEAMQQNPTDEHIQMLMDELDTNNDGQLDWTEFTRAIEIQREREENKDKEADLLGAFVAMGGKEDGTGKISSELLSRTIKEDFKLLIKIDDLIDDLDKQSEKELTFDEFKQLLG